MTLTYSYTRSVINATVGLPQFQDADEHGLRNIYDIIQLLLKFPGVEVNAQDLRGGLTPLYYAANAGSKEVIEILLEHGANPQIVVTEGQSLREIIDQNIPGFDFLAYATKVKKMPTKQKLFNFAETNDLNGLKRLAYFSSKEDQIDWNCNNGSMTLLQLACVHGHDKVVAFLLQRDCKPNLTTPTEGRTPLLIAAHHGYYKILDVLKRCPKVNFAAVEVGTGKTVLHQVFLRDSAKHLDGRNVSNSSYQKCVKVLLGKGYPRSHAMFHSQIGKIINYQEKLDGNTALHLATMQADQDIIKVFLKRGANMGVKNFREKTAVESILPDTLNEFLSEDCIEHDGIITDEDFRLTFKYDFLAPPILSEKMLERSKEQQEEAEQPAASEDTALPETEALWYLSTASKRHRALLKHPVISSFLWLKWQRIRTLFYINLFLYILFVIFLTAFIFLRYGGYSVQPPIPRVFPKAAAADDGGGMARENPENNEFNKSNQMALIFLTVGLTILIAILGLRELFQVFVSFKRYFFSPENLMELLILILSCIIIYDQDGGGVSFDVKRHLAALCILFTWTETLILVGRHPRLSTNITMFTTVITTFFAFLLWYSIIIIAFGISFYIMMHEDHKEGEPDSDYPFFDTIWLCLFKTSAMFVGELEFSDIPFTGNVISYLIFLSFIFLIVVVLMNLLNGLAVSDTGLIRDEAEIVGWSARVELITYTESMLLGDPFYFLSNWPPIKLLQRIPSCAVCRFLYKFPRVREVLQKISGGTKILLFYTCLPDKKATFYPNKKSRRGLLSYKKSLKIDDNPPTSSHQQGKEQKLAISNEVLDSAKELLLEKMRAGKAEKEQQDLKETLNAMGERMLVMEELLLTMASRK